MSNSITYDEAAELGKSYFLKEQLSFMLPDGNLHKKSFNADNIIHCFGSIPFYKRAQIPDNEIDDGIKKEMDDVAAQHYEEYTKVLSSVKNKSGFMCKKRSGTPSKTGLSEAIYSFYGKEFEPYCYGAIMDNAEKPIEIDDLFPDEIKRLQEKESSDEDVEKNVKEFNDFCTKLCDSRAYRFCLLSSEESSLSSESDDEYTDDATEYFAFKKETLDQLLRVSASKVTDQSPQSPTKDYSFKEVTYDSTKPSILQSFEIRENKVLERQRARAQRAHIRNLRLERRKARVMDIASQSTDGVEVPLDEIDKRMQSIGIPRPRKVETYDRRRKVIAEERLKKQPNIVDDPIFFSPQEFGDYKNAPIPVKNSKNKCKTHNQKTIKGVKEKHEDHSTKSKWATQSDQVKHKQTEQGKKTKDSIESKTPKQNYQGTNQKQNDQNAKSKQMDQTVKSKQSDQNTKPKIDQSAKTKQMDQTVKSKQSDQNTKPKIDQFAKTNQSDQKPKQPVQLTKSREEDLTEGMIPKKFLRHISSSDDDDDLEELEEYAASLLRKKHGGLSSSKRV